MTIDLAGLRWRPHSPSLFELEGYPLHIGVGDDRKWYIALDELGWQHGCAFDTREQAAAKVAAAFGIEP